jgi:4-diphosphocytidyl-2-C-methyl-D-erythritol kinase
MVSFGQKLAPPELMGSLCLSAPAKINLHLEVLGLRSDGFHELAMVMQTINLADRLHASLAGEGQLNLQCNRPGLPLDGSNLITKAARALRNFVGQEQLGATLILDKQIPIGAGLAGGSSDAATVLLLLQQLWQLKLSPADLQTLAAQLGSDVAFCLAGGTQLCFGRGEQLQPLGAAPQLGVLLLKHPDVSVSTPWAYSRSKQLRGGHYLKGEQAFEQRRELLRCSPLSNWLEAGLATDALQVMPAIRNDLQEVVAPELPSVQIGLKLLAAAPAALASAMSGSGPTSFALFASEAAAQDAADQLQPELKQHGFDHWVCAFQPARSLTPHTHG